MVKAFHQNGSHTCKYNRTHKKEQQTRQAPRWGGEGAGGVLKPALRRLTSGTHAGAWGASPGLCVSEGWITGDFPALSFSYSVSYLRQRFGRLEGNNRNLILRKIYKKNNNQLTPIAAPPPPGQETGPRLGPGQTGGSTGCCCFLGEGAGLLPSRRRSWGAGRPWPGRGKPPSVYLVQDP